MSLSPQVSSHVKMGRADQLVQPLQCDQTAPEHPLTGAVVLCLMMLPLLLCSWILSFAPFDDLLNRDGKPLLVDFVCFYTAGDCVNTGHMELLYDDQWADQKSIELFPSLKAVGGIKLPYRYPPIVAVLISPLARFDYATACVAFLVICSSCLLMVFRTWRREFSAVQDPGTLIYYVACFGFPTVLESLIGGQLSVFTFAIVSAGVLLLRKQKVLSAGFVLGLTAFKPNVAILLILGLVLRYPRLLIGLTISGVVMLLANILLAGSDTLTTYIELMRSLSSSRWETAAPFWKIQGLQPYFELLVGSRAKLVTLVTGALLVMPVVYQWRRSRISFGDGVSLLLMINCLFGMYVPIYDLILLLPIIYLQADQLQDQGRGKEDAIPTIFSERMVSWVAMLIIVGPHLSQALVSQTGMQIFPPLLLIVLLTAVITSFREWPQRFNSHSKSVSVESM